MHLEFVPPEPPNEPGPAEAWKHMSRRQRILFVVIFVVGVAADLFLLIRR